MLTEYILAAMQRRVAIPNQHRGVIGVNLLGAFLRQTACRRRRRPDASRSFYDSRRGGCRLDGSPCEATRSLHHTTLQVD